MPRPNILYIHSHDTGRYIQPYGHGVPTPHMQQLAEEGVLFRQNYCAAPTCSPSRAALLTGQSPHSSGMTGLAHRGFSLHDYRQHIVHMLRHVGYRSTLIGVQHIASDAALIGYDEIVPLESDRVAHVAPAAAQFLADRPEQPFFLSVGFSETHRVFPEAGPDDDPRYCLPPHPLPDTPETRRDMAQFKTSARTYDRGVGMVLKALDAAGLGENTLVICTTDHGIAFPGLKCNLTDHGIGVMLIVRGPGGFEGGKVCDAMVSHIDLYPTICDLIGVERPSWLQGASLLPLVEGAVDQIHDEIYAEVTYHAAYEPMRAVRTLRHKYIRRFVDRSSPVLPNCDDSPSKDVWMRAGWQQRAPASEQLYDLVFDPNETCNLAAAPEAAAVLRDMRARLERWMRETDDPLLRGHVPAPAGALANDPDGISPREAPQVL
ncbi:MAG: sulfatase [Anaerolineae bacterium]|nr:sulfatase [Anaerolineae bacterium]